MVSLIGALISGVDSGSATGEGNIALILVDGPIMVQNSGGYFSDGGASSETLVKQINSAESDESIEAIILMINSPGGSAVASDEIAQAVLNSEKPVVSVIREVGASGAYWIASASDHVVANRMSITGSIGVISSYLEFSGLMENYGVSYERLVAGDKKDVGNPFRTLGASERDLLQEKIDLIHDYFIDAVAENRGLSRGEVAEVATGEFYLGVEALNLGLIDGLGDLETAKSYIEDELKIEIEGLVSYDAPESIFDVLAELSVLHGFALGKSMGDSIVLNDGNLKNTLAGSGVKV